MAERMLLEVGAQVAAAALVQTCAADVANELKGLGATLESTLPSFKGGSSVGLVRALDTWFTTAATLPTILQDYATALAAVDLAVAAADSTGTSTLAATSAARLNLGSGDPR